MARYEEFTRQIGYVWRLAIAQADISFAEAKMSANLDEFDCGLEHLKRVRSIAKQFKVNPQAVFVIQCKIAAANFIYSGGDSERLAELGEQLNTSEDPMAYFTANVRVTFLKELGVDKQNVRSYLDQLLIEFEEMARHQYSPAISAFSRDEKPQEQDTI